MIPGPVLLVAAVISSPALWAAVVTGDMPLDVALTRYLVAVGVCWTLLSLAAPLVWPSPAAADSAPEAEPPS